MRKRLAEAEKNLGNVEFVIGQASTAEETAQLLAKAGPDAPVLAVSADIFGLQLNASVMPTVFKQGRPVAVFHLPVIGGHDWCLVNPWREEGHRITLFNSSDYNELERAAALLRVIPLLRQSRVLVSPPFKGTPESYDAGASESSGWASKWWPSPTDVTTRSWPSVDAAAAEAEAQAVARRGGGHRRADPGGRGQGRAGESDAWIS